MTFDGGRTDFLAGGGEMGARMRAFDWEPTPLGPPAAWPQSLKTIVRVILDSRYAMWMLWGPEFTFFCNDAYLPTVGNKRDWVLGARSDRVWEEIWPDIGPRIEHVLRTGAATWDEELLLFLERRGYPEETYHTFSYSPVYGDDNRIAGMLCVVTETTQQVIEARRVRVLREIAAQSTRAQAVGELCAGIVAALDTDPSDVPFAAIYLFDERAGLARRAGLTRLAPAAALPPEIALAAGPAWPLEAAARSARPVLLEKLPEHLGVGPPGPWPEPVARALVLPLKAAGVAAPAGFLIVGISTRAELDDRYRSFFELAGGQISAALADAAAYETERRRAEALAEIDRAKTAFFSNVSHEFRTPLTLILGPVEELAADPRLASPQLERVALIHRNALRLQKLVNSLLDFSRIEAGRMPSAFQATDLTALTRELAAGFAPAIESAGLRFVIETEPGLDPVYVDPEQWERIVLNLLSNAFKYTLEGEVRLHLKRDDGHAVLEVQDTGIGIAAADLPRIFERFHRIEGSSGRSVEGSGIGLALVQELVRLHGGEVSVQSQPGRGSTFRVRLPFGRAHLPGDRIAENGVDTAHGEQPRRLAATFVQESLQWRRPPSEEVAAAVATPAVPLAVTERRFASTFGARLVLADDSADMRAHLRSILAPHYRLETVADGRAALAALRRESADLLLSDVMMPGLDGFGLLRAVREDAALGATPVILLSARAGEEARVEGLDAGADDYLIKPFSARELLARVGALLELVRMRRESAQRERALADAEREQLLSAERAARADAEAATRIKDDFLATLSHELRTPLSVIVSWSRILQQRFGAADEQLAKGLRLILKNGLAQSQLISDLLDMSRIGAGKITLDTEPIDLNELIVEVANSQRPAAETRGLVIHTRPIPQPALVQGDPTRLQQVLWNLITNAIKFTPPGGEVTVSLARLPEKMEISVRDTGEGIAPEFLPQLFERFRQAEGGASRRHGGLGLGLAIVRQLVDLHGGEVHADSAGPGRGSTFTVRLPALGSPATDSLDSTGTFPGLVETLEPNLLSGLAVMAVEDQPDMLEYLRRVLEEQGARVVVASSGAQALELLRDGAGARHLDVLLADISMPEMDGYELIRTVREALAFDALALPAVAVTAFARDEDRTRALRAGFQAHLSKPYRVAQLVSVINRVRKRAAGAGR
jgi:signal transduction histidine kinase